ncbi:MAG TPA: hypothetical protein VFZ76_17080 [Anaerolineales bacterium]
MPRKYIFPLLVFFSLLLSACRLTGGSQVEDIQAAQLPSNTTRAAAPSDQKSAALAPEAPLAATPTITSTLPEKPPKSCPVTQPQDPPYVPSAPVPATAPYAGQFWYGEQDLWTMLPVDGTWGQLARGEKVFWWREGYDGSQEPEPELAMNARRLDGPAPEAHSDSPATNAYHPDFHWAMLQGFSVATPGCWEITGKYGGHELSFVVWVAP